MEHPLKREEIRQAYREYCDRIASRFGLSSWAPLNQLTRMVTTNLGDVDAFRRAEAECPSTAWGAIRVLVAFETPRERPMYMSYVFIGRTPTGEEVVALFDATKEWKVLSRSSSATEDPEQCHPSLPGLRDFPQPVLPLETALHRLWRRWAAPAPPRPAAGSACWPHRTALSCCRLGETPLSTPIHGSANDEKNRSSVHEGFITVGALMKVAQVMNDH